MNTIELSSSTKCLLNKTKELGKLISKIQSFKIKVKGKKKGKIINISTNLDKITEKTKQLHQVMQEINDFHIKNN